MLQGERHREPGENPSPGGLQAPVYNAPPGRTRFPTTARALSAPRFPVLRRRARRLTAHLPRSVSVLGSVGLLGFVGSCLLFVGVATLDMAIYLALSTASLTLYALALLVGYLADPYALQRAQALRQARSRRIHRNSDRFTRSSGVWRTRVTSL